MNKLFLYAIIACITSVMPMTIKAAEAYAAFSNDNTTLTFYYDNQKSSRNGMDIGPFESKKDRGWHEYCNEITTVVFDASFTQKTDLVSTAYWFKGFGNLTTISGIENLNTHKVIDMSSMFDDCSSLKKIDLSSFNTENVENMQGMFIECESLTTLDLRNFNTSRVKNMSMMFAGCVNLNNPYLKSFSTENVTEMWSMFEDCKTLTELDISNFNTSNVIDMRYMFADCYCLRQLDLSSFNTSNVTNMNCLFQGSKTLKTVYVSDEWNTAKVEKGERVFNDCYNIVGGKGTVYDENNIDHTYAHIDGGESNPGYLTYYKDGVSPKKEGDANGDDTVNAADIVELVNYIMGSPSGKFDDKAADVNGDGVVNAADIVAIVNIIMGAN